MHMRRPVVIRIDDNSQVAYPHNRGHLASLSQTQAVGNLKAVGRCSPPSDLTIRPDLLQDRLVVGAHDLKRAVIQSCPGERGVSRGFGQ